LFLTRESSSRFSDLIHCLISSVLREKRIHKFYKETLIIVGSADSGPWGVVSQISQVFPYHKDKASRTVFCSGVVELCVFFTVFSNKFEIKLYILLLFFYAGIELHVKPVETFLLYFVGCCCFYFFYMYIQNPITTEDYYIQRMLIYKFILLQN
jgi:hypothetical protein